MSNQRLIEPPEEGDEQFPGFHKMKSESDAFDAEYRNFIEHDQTHVSVILRSHLVVEHFLDKFIAAAFPTVGHWEKMRLNFDRKIDLVDHPRYPFPKIVPGLKALNKLRNHIAHELTKPPCDSELEPMSLLLKLWEPTIPAPVGLKLVEDFSLFASLFLNGVTRAIQEHAPKTGYAGLMQYYADPIGYKGK
jgi:hypothetical protein